MHRSGTSLLAGVLRALGVTLPGHLIPADEHNPEGYFEWREVVDLQERLLIDLDRWWPSAQGNLPMPNRWLDHPASLKARKELRALLLQVIKQQSDVWAIKDPRISRLMPLWLDLAAELAIPLRLVISVRDPAEVVCSLMHRDGASTGMNLARAQQLWWRHNLEPLHAFPKELPLMLVDYGRWFSEPEMQLSKLLELIPEIQPSDVERSSSLALICPEHRRSLKSSTTFSIHRRVNRLYGQLLAKKTRHWPSSEPPMIFRLTGDYFSSPPNDPSCWPNWINQLQYYPAPRYAESVGLAREVVLSLCGSTYENWSTHLWISRLPILGFRQCKILPNDFDSHNLLLSGSDQNGLNRFAVNFELPSPERASHWLSHLRTQQLIWDPLPPRVLLLRGLGLPAYWLDPENPPNGWLDRREANDPSSWSSLLGLAPPVQNAIVVLGHGGGEWDRSLAIESVKPLPSQETPPIIYLPGWSELIANNLATAYSLAGWLMCTSSLSKAIVWIGHEPDPSQACLSVRQLKVQPPIVPLELRAELSGQPYQALSEDRVTPPCNSLFDWNISGQYHAEPFASVLISLFNYAEFIVPVLESVVAQQQCGLELIVVDDCSSDGGHELALSWMKSIIVEKPHPFVRILFLRHSYNSGLAVARNTAFAAARASWCFVLDADNVLFPNAVSECLSIASSGSSQLAVVHPLLAVEADADRQDDQRSLVSSQSWQRDAFRFGNFVDAMALVRRSSWEAVGGYTHINGGWEDFDFWCKLVEVGYHGILCPKILAVYQSHAKSMSHNSTNHCWRALSRTLQARHSWLELPLAKRSVKFL